GVGRTERAPRLEVSSTTEALLALAAHERRAFGGTVVAVTGANGKTSTKDLTAAVLAARVRVHASPRSVHNDVRGPRALPGAPQGAAGWSAAGWARGGRGTSHS